MKCAVTGYRVLEENVELNKIIDINEEGLIQELLGGKNCAVRVDNKTEI